MRQRLTFTILLVLAVAVGVVPRLVGEANPDVAWYSFLAESLLAGTDLYTEILEVNPPWPVWATVPAAGVADVLRLKTSLVFNLMVVVLALIVLAAARRRLAVEVIETANRRDFLATALVALLLVPGLSFGQREHLAVVFSFPYLLSVALGEAEGDHRQIATGLLAGVGFAFKPHFVLVPLVAEGWAWLRDRASHRLVRPATVTLAGVLVTYAVAVWLVEPDYFDVLWNLVLPFYPHFNPRPWWAGLVSVPAVLTYFGVLATYLCVRRGNGWDSPAGCFAVYALTWLALAALQQQDMSYHYLPAVVCALVAIGASLTLSVPDGSRVGRATAVGALALLSLLFAYLHADELRKLAVDRPTEYERLREAVSSGRSDDLEIAALNGGFAKVFSLLNDTGAGWMLRYPGVWPILAARRKARSSQPDSVLPPSSGRSGGEVSLAPLSRREREFRDHFVQDLTSGDPDVFLVPHVFTTGRDDRLDMLGYFRRDTAFARWFDGYRRQTRVAGLEVYVKE